MHHIYHIYYSLGFLSVEPIHSWISFSLQSNCARFCTRFGTEITQCRRSQTSYFGLHLSVTAVFSPDWLNKLQQRKKNSRVWFQQTKHCRYESTLRLRDIKVKLCTSHEITGNSPRLLHIAINMTLLRKHSFGFFILLSTKKHLKRYLLRVESGKAIALRNSRLYYSFYPSIIL